MYLPPLTISIAECPGPADIEPPLPPAPPKPPAPPAPPSPPEPASPELELELVLEVDEDISPELLFPDVIPRGGVVVPSLQEAASADRSNAIEITAAWLVRIIHRLAVRATRSRSEQRLFLENKCEFFVMVLLGRTPSHQRGSLRMLADGRSVFVRSTKLPSTPDAR